MDVVRHGRARITYDSGAGIDPTLSPRPYLTATTALGTPVTEVGPADHLHHLGMSAALPDVDGTSFWGGRTFVRDVGSTMLDNHGIQRTVSLDTTDGSVRETLVWFDRDGAPLLEEERTITGHVADGRVEVAWMSHLTAVERDVTFGSPQTNGRPGAFYGGVFWRTPFDTARVRTADGDGIERAHGSRSPWLAVEGADASLVAATADPLPWFVRNTGYVGFGPAVATDARRVLAQGERLTLHLAVAALEESPADPAAVADALLATAATR